MKDFYDTPIGELTNRDILQHELKVVIIAVIVGLVIWGFVALYKKLDNL